MDSKMKKIVSSLIDRYLQVISVNRKLEEMGVSIEIVDQLIGGDFEIWLAASVFHPVIMDDPDHEFLPSELGSVCDRIYESDVEQKPNIIIQIFIEILDFFNSEFDHGTLARSDHEGTVYINKGGEKLELESLFIKYGV